MTNREPQSEVAPGIGTSLVLAAGFALTATATDAGRLLGQNAASGDRLVVLRTTVLWALGAGAALGMVRLILALGTAFLRRRPPGGVGAALLAGLALGLPATFLLRDLLEGPAISRAPSIGLYRLVATLVPTLAFGLAAFTVNRIDRARFGLGRAFRASLAIGCALLVPILAVADGRLYAYRYPSFHALVWLGIAALLVLPSRRLALRLRRRGVILLAVLLVLAATVAALLPLRWMGSQPSCRSLAARGTSFTKLLLFQVAPLPPIRPARVDPALLESLGRSAAVDPARLDELLPGRRRFNVFIVSIDALRADRLARAGYPRRICAATDAFLDESVAFDAAWTTYPATGMAFASLFSGLYPSSTDVAQAFWSSGERLAERGQPTLPGILSRAGWRTEAATGFSANLTALLAQLKTGFEVFDAHARLYPPAHDVDCLRVTPHVLEAIDRDDGRPFLVWTHLFDPHEPYAPVGPALFGKEPKDLYDAEVYYADRQVATLLLELQRRGLDANTVVVLLADHGQEFGEHGRFFHVSALCEAQIHVPLGIRVPGLAPRQVRTPVDFTCIMPTLLEILGVEAPPLQGRSLLPEMLGSADRPDEAVSFAELREADLLVGSRQSAVRRGRWKLWVDESSRKESLFDLSADPQEERDLAAAEPEKLRELQSLLDTEKARLATVRTAAPPAFVDGRPQLEIAGRILDLRDDESCLTLLRQFARYGCPDLLEGRVLDLEKGLVRPEWKALLRRCLARRPVDATPTPAAVARRLQRLRADLADERPVVAREALIALLVLGDRDALNVDLPRLFPETTAAEVDERSARQRLRFELWRGLRIRAAGLPAPALETAIDRAMALLRIGDCDAVDEQDLLEVLLALEEPAVLDYLRERASTPAGLEFLEQCRRRKRSEGASARSDLLDALEPRAPQPTPSHSESPAFAASLRAEARLASRPTPGQPALVYYDLEAPAGGTAAPKGLRLSIRWSEPGGEEILLRQGLALGPPRVETKETWRGAARVLIPEKAGPEGRLLLKVE